MRDYRHDYPDFYEESFYDDLGEGLEDGPAEFDWDEMDEEDWESFFDQADPDNNF